MSDRTTAYAAAILEIGRAEDSLDAVTGELQQLAQAVGDNEELRNALSDPRVPVGRRLTLLESEVLTAASNGTRAAVAMLLAGGHGGDLPEVATDLARLAAESSERELAEVTVAVPLTDDRREALRRALEAATGKSLELQVAVDPDVVGGVRAVVGDTVFDGSLAHRLAEVRTRLAG
jgi:F-type H+-transporting ATPase subunit delta